MLDAREAQPASSKPRKTPSPWFDSLYPEQVEAYWFLKERLAFGGGAGLVSEQGTGKTIISLALLEKMPLKSVLIICPLTAVDATWSDRLRTLPYTICGSLDAYRACGSERRVLLVHYELATKLAKRLQRMEPWDLVIIDESQRIKARGSAQSRTSRKLRHAHRRLILSGTPLDKSPMDIWAQMRFVDHTVLGEDWQPFADEWCNRGGFKGYQWRFRMTKLDAFLKKLEPYLFRLTLDQPKPELHLVNVDLLGKQRDLYDAMERHSLIRVNGSTIKADLPVTKKLRLEQITGGFIGDDNGDEIDLGRAKERKLRTLVRHLDPPIVVTGKFLHDIEVIKRVLDEQFDAVGVLAGEIKGVERTNVIRDFQAGKLDAIAVQVRTGGVSIELSHAHQLIVYSMNHSRIDFDQMIARLRRLGQQRTVKIFLILALDTVDEGIRNIVEQKCRDAYKVESHFERSTVMAKKTAKKAKRAAKENGDGETTASAGAFGVEDVAKALKVEPGTARALMRKANIKRSGKSYAFKTKKEVDECVRKIERMSA